MATTVSGNLVVPSLESLEAEEADEIQLEQHSGNTPLLGQCDDPDCESSEGASSPSPSMHTCKTFELDESDEKKSNKPNQVAKVPAKRFESPIGAPELPRPQTYNKCNDKRMSTVSMASFVAVLAPYINNFTTSTTSNPQDDAEQALKKLCQSPAPRSTTFLHSKRSSCRRRLATIPTRTSSRAINDWSHSLDVTFNSLDHDLEDSTYFQAPGLPEVPSTNTGKSHKGIWDTIKRHGHHKKAVASSVPSNIKQHTKGSKRQRFMRFISAIFNGNPQTEVTTPSVAPPRN